MAKTFEIDGELILESQEGGYADDTFVVIQHREQTGLREDRSVMLSDAIAEYFGVEREYPSGNRRIGRHVWIRITVVEE